MVTSVTQRHQLKILALVSEPSLTDYESNLFKIEPEEHRLKPVLTVEIDLTSTVTITQVAAYAVGRPQRRTARMNSTTLKQPELYPSSVSSVSLW
ncbi:MAG: hypothetical protein KatS3mg054_0753 [Chloroflexus sp.]|nr:MAG: hypothetical protein KatS3mg054_0753 [Chloroflexus sp.]